jgi:CubicO group peptidase (beta-lactamase class C family)
VRDVNNPNDSNTLLSQPNYGKSVHFRTQIWIDPKEKIVGILMTQTANNQVRGDFENTVMQAVIEPAPGTESRDRTN